jgi:PAS domain S-box-containing protein
MSGSGLIAVVDGDLAQRVALVEELSARGAAAYGVAEVGRLAQEPREPAMLLIRGPAAQIEAAITTVRQMERFAGVPLMLSSDMQTATAFDLGALDVTALDASLDELCARAIHRLRQSMTPLAAWEPYEHFFDSSPDGILVVTMSGQVRFSNPAASKITGRSHKELCSGSFDDVLSPDGRKRFDKLRGNLGTGTPPSNVDLPIRTGRGKRRVLNVSFSVLRDHGKVIISLRDVTEARALARELNKTKEFLQRVIDSSVDAIVAADMTGKVLLFNPAAERTYGWSRSAVMGTKNVRDLYPEGTARAIMESIRSDAHGGEGVLENFETELLGREGQPIPVLLSASLISHRGRVIGSVGVFTDLRARRQIEERLANAQKELAVQEKKAFVAELAGATAHELNQPLTTVMGYTGMLEKQLGNLDDKPRVQRALSSIVAETERMAEIVRKIGKLTKYESKAYVGETKIIDIERSIDNEPPVTGL